MVFNHSYILMKIFLYTPSLEILNQDLMLLASQNMVWFNHMYLTEAKIKLGKAYGQCFMPFIHKVYDFSVRCPVNPLASADLFSLVVSATLEIC